MQQTKSTDAVIRVLLADMHHIVRNGVRQEINNQADMLVVGETTNGYEALDLSWKLKPDVVVLDIKLAGLNGIKVARRLCKTTWNTISQSNQAPLVLVFSAYSDKQYVWSLLAAGVRGYLLKNEPIEQLPTGIRQIVAGQTVLSQIVQTNLIELIPYLNQELSDAEIKVMQMLAHGLSNWEIAQNLHITEGTVKSHLTNTYRKIPWVRSRAEAVTWAWINRIVPESE